jgi:hypothetical protein
MDGTFCFQFNEFNKFYYLALANEKCEYFKYFPSHTSQQDFFIAAQIPQSNN